MKRLLLVSLCLTGFMANAMQQQEQRSPLRQQLDAEREAFLRLQQPLLDDAAASASDVPLVTVESMAVAGGGASPARPVVAAHDGFARADLQQQFGSLEQYLNANPDEALKIMAALENAANSEKHPSLRKRIGIVTAETITMLGLTGVISSIGTHPEIAAIVQHLTAVELLRNTSDISLLKRFLVGAGLLVATELFEWLYVGPTFGVKLGIPNVNLFFVLGIVVKMIREQTHVTPSKQTFTESVRSIFNRCRRNA